MMGALSRHKGARGERELAAVWRRLWGVGAKRGQQHSGVAEGGGNHPDVRHDIPGITIECKRVQLTTPGMWLERARRDSAEGDIPIVCHRANHQPWHVVVALEDLPKLVERLWPYTQAAAMDEAWAGPA